MAKRGNPTLDEAAEIDEGISDMESMQASDEELGAERETRSAAEVPDGARGAMRGGAKNRVADVMTREPRTITPDTPIEEAARLFAELDSGALPVVDSVDDPTPIGMLTDRDIVTRVLAEGDNPLELTVADCMTSPALTVGMDDDVEDVVHIFEQAQVRRAIVVDDAGHCCGILSQADLAFVLDDALAAEMVRAVSQPSEGEARVPKEG